MVEQKVEQPVVEPSKEPKQEEPKVTPEDDIIATKVKEQLDTRLEAIKKEAEAKAFEKYQGIQRTVAEKDKEIRRLKETKSPSPSSDTHLSLIVDEIENLQKQSGAEDSPRIRALKAELEQEKRIAAQEKVVNTERERLEDEIRKANLDPEDDRFLDVWESFGNHAAVDGKFDITWKRLNKIMKEVKPVVTNPEPPKPKEDLDKTIEDKVQEKLRAEFEKRGWLESPTSEPSSSGGKLRYKDIQNYSTQGKTTQQIMKEAEEIANKFTKGG